MRTLSPSWRFIDNLGDVNPIDHGGYFVFTDSTGVYPDEAELLKIDDDGSATVYRFMLEKCTFINGILSDNRFHPDKSAWFAKPESERANRPQDSTYLSNVAECCGMDEGELIDMLCSGDPIQLAIAYRAIGDYHGFDNLDSYPLQLSADEVAERYACHPYTKSPVG